MNQRVRAFLFLVPLFGIAPSILAGDTDQRTYPVVEMFVNNDHTGDGRFDGKSGCSSRVAVFDDPTVRVVEESLICGHPGHVSKVTWTFLRTSPEGDVYKVSRKYPSDSDAPTTETKEATYSGKPLTLWEDDHQKILLRPAGARSDDGPKVGEGAPGVVAVDAAGDQYVMPWENRKGKVVLLTFWTLDPKSLSGMPMERLGQLSREFADDERFQIITVCVNGPDDWDAFGEFWRRRHQGGKESRIGGVHWWVMMQWDVEEPTTARRYGVVDTPAHYLIDVDGRLAAVRIAPGALKETISRHLKQKP